MTSLNTASVHQKHPPARIACSCAMLLLLCCEREIGCGWRETNSSPGFPGEGDHAKHGGGVLLTPKNPSTALRAVPLPGKCRGGIASLSAPPEAPAAPRTSPPMDRS